MYSRKILAPSTKQIDKNNTKQTKKKIITILIGAIIGFVNGFFGGGGGMVCVPALEKFLKLPVKKAHATAIAVIFPLSFISSVIYVLNGSVLSNPLIFVTIGVVFGGVFGSFLLKILPTKIIGFIFAFLMILAGVKLLIWII